jgi:hypothetical protein
MMKNYERLLVWEERLENNKKELINQVNFNEWIPGWEHIQRKNKKLNCIYFLEKIKQCEERINHFK